MSTTRPDTGAPEAYARGPRLYGVPVPARAFGLTAGWYRSSDRSSHESFEFAGNASNSESSLEPREDSASNVVPMDQSVRERADRIRNMGNVAAA